MAISSRPGNDAALMLFRCTLGLLLAALCACSNDDPCTDLGPDDAIIVISEPDSTLRDAVDGVTVPLIRPIQGGQILLVGARVRSTEPCSYRAVASIHDPVTDAQLGLDMLELELKPQPDGWAIPDAGFVPLLDVPVCPSEAASGRVDGMPQRLRVALSDVSGMTPIITVESTVIPTCSDAGCTVDCM